LSRCRQCRLAIALIGHDIDFRAKQSLKLVPRLGLVIAFGAAKIRTQPAPWGCGLLSD
jgi:hypothetical protein